MGLSDGWDEWRERIGGRSVLVSLLAHALLLALIWADVLWFSPHEDPPAIEVELTAEAPPAPHLKPQPEAPKPPEIKPPEPKPPEPKPEAQPEPPPEPKPEPKPEAEPPKPAAKPVAKPEPVPLIKPGPKPVLTPGKLAKESHEGAKEGTGEGKKHSWLDDVESADAGRPATGISSQVSPTEAMDVGKGGKKNGEEDTGGPATQSERDFLLAQILTKWKRPFGTWPPDAVVRLRVRVLANGYLAPPFDARMPYAPATAIVGYNQMARNDPRLAVLETLFVAIRVAQPLTLAPELRAKAPFGIALDFKLNDVN